MCMYIHIVDGRSIPAADNETGHSLCKKTNILFDKECVNSFIASKSFELPDALADLDGLSSCLWLLLLDVDFIALC